MNHSCGGVRTWINEISRRARRSRVFGASRRASCAGRIEDEEGHRSRREGADTDLRRRDGRAARTGFPWHRHRRREPNREGNERATARCGSGRSGQRRATGPGRPKLGWSLRAKSLCCRGIGTGSTVNPGVHRSRCASLWRRRGCVNEGPDRIRRSQESAYRFMSAMAGNLPGFEEATRALFARKADSFENQIRGWPKDVRTYLTRLVREVMEVQMSGPTQKGRTA